MRFRVGGEVVELDEAARVADRLGLLGQERVDWFASRAVSRDDADEIRSSTIRVGPPVQVTRG